MTTCKEIIDLCYEEFTKRKKTTCCSKTSSSFSVGIDGKGFYEVSLEGFTVDDEDEINDKKWLATKYQKPIKKIEDHFDVLEACLCALARSEHLKKITDMSTDGDHKDCEAIFNHEDEGYLILKIR